MGIERDKMVACQPYEPWDAELAEDRNKARPLASLQLQAGATSLPNPCACCDVILPLFNLQVEQLNKTSCREPEKRLALLKELQVDFPEDAPPFIEPPLALDYVSAQLTT